MRLFKNYKKDYENALLELRQVYKDLENISFLYNEAKKDIKELDNAVTIAYKKIEALKNQVKSLRGKIGGLTKENNKLKSNAYLRVKVPADKSKGNQKTRIKSGRGQGELKKISAAEFMVENRKVTRK